MLRICSMMCATLFARNHGCGPKHGCFRQGDNPASGSDFARGRACTSVKPDNVAFKLQLDQTLRKNQPDLNVLTREAFMKAKAVAVLVLACMSGLLCASSALAQSGDVAVVVSPLNSASALSLGELRKVFNGEKHFWPSVSMIKLLVRRSGSRERNILLHLLGCQRVSTSSIAPVRSIGAKRSRNQSPCLQTACRRKLLPHTPGVIALVDAAEVNPGVKVLKIDGHMPGEEHYPLRIY
jgi:hypothetical protein